LGFGILLLTRRLPLSSITTSDINKSTPFQITAPPQHSPTSIQKHPLSNNYDSKRKKKIGKKVPRIAHDQSLNILNTNEVRK